LIAFLVVSADRWRTWQ